MRPFRRYLCYLRGHRRVFEVHTLRHMLSAHLHPEIGTKGHCSFCGYKWEDVRPDDEVRLLLTKYLNMTGVIK